MARQVVAKWDAGMNTVTTIGGFQMPIGEDAKLADGSQGPYPTEVLLAGVASCFAISLAWVARKRDLTLPNLSVAVSGDYDGPRISAIDIAVTCDADPELVDALIKRAQHVCYVTNTLRKAPEITFRRAAA